MKRGRLRGFSFVELLATLAIVAALASMAVPLAQMMALRTREAELRRGLQDIRQAIDRYKKATETGQIAFALGESGYPHSLGDLVEGVESLLEPGRRIFFLRHMPRDPFVLDATLAASDTWGLRSFASPADRPLPGADVFDVYSRSERVGLNGLPYRDW